MAKPHGRVKLTRNVIAKPKWKGEAQTKCDGEANMEERSSKETLWRSQDARAKLSRNVMAKPTWKSEAQKKRDGEANMEERSSQET